MAETDDAAELPAGLGPRGWAALAWPAVLFTVIIFFFGADITADVSNGNSTTHLTAELTALALFLAGAAGTGLELRSALRRARIAERALRGARAELERHREESQALLQGLGAAIDAQLLRWELTAAEREVAVLILKGLSYREVADLRRTSEHTVRNQAFAIYRKAGLASRAEMAAYFLEDLLAPGSAAQHGADRSAAP